ncbi:MAG: CARDB domain-containing protein [Pirellulaceae bacterium]
MEREIVADDSGVAGLGYRSDVAGKDTIVATIGSLASTTREIEWIPRANLTVTDISAPDVVAQGQTVDVGFTIQNTEATPGEAWWEDSLYLSDDETPDIDERIRSFFRQDINGHEEYSQSFAWQFLHDPGDYYLIVVADSLSGTGLFEDNETDNIRIKPIRITLDDLRADSIATTSSTAIKLGEPFPVNWTVTNTSVDSIETGVTDAIWLSSDSVLDDGDLLIQEFSASDFLPLDPGQSYTQQMNLTIPLDSSIEAETYYLLLETDSRSRITETDEDNNIVASNALAVTLPLAGFGSKRNLGTRSARVRIGCVTAVDLGCIESRNSGTSNRFVDEIYVSPTGSILDARHVGTFEFPWTLSAGATSGDASQ